MACAAASKYSADRTSCDAPPPTKVGPSNEDVRRAPLVFPAMFATASGPKSNAVLDGNETKRGLVCARGAHGDSGGAQAARQREAARRRNGVPLPDALTPPAE